MNGLNSHKLARPGTLPKHEVTIYTHPKTPNFSKYASILSLIPAELQTVTFLIKSIKKLKHSEPDAGRAPNGHVLNQIYSETEAF